MSFVVSRDYLGNVHTSGCYNAASTEEAIKYAEQNGETHIKLFFKRGEASHYAASLKW